MTDNPTPNKIALLREALKPCPFCGGKPRLDIGKVAFEDAEVSCDGCGSCGPNHDDGFGGQDNARLAVAAWNTRAALAPGQHDGAAGEGTLANPSTFGKPTFGFSTPAPTEEWLNDPASLEGGLPTIPAGMKAWAGGDGAPADWDGGKVMSRGQGLQYPDHLNGGRWGRERTHPFFSEDEKSCDIIAYTPKSAPTEQARAEGYVLVPPQATQEIVDAMEAVDHPNNHAALYCDLYAAAIAAAMLAAAGDDAVGGGDHG